MARNTRNSELAIYESCTDNFSEIIDKLWSLTETFRKNLDRWTDSEGKTIAIEIDGKATFIYHADSMAVRNYAKEYTKIWTEQSEMMKEEMKRLWFIDCRGLYIDENIWSSNKFRDWAPVKFDFSIFADVRNLLSEQFFLGFASFVETKFIGDADFTGSQFRDLAFFDCASFSKNLFFSKVKFAATASFQRLDSISGGVDFSNASFGRAPLFHESKLPQGTSFDETTFDIKHGSLLQNEISDDARAFRTLKQVAANYRGQQDEADFFALEQRTRRIAFLAPHLNWKRDPWGEHKRGLRDLFVLETWRGWNDWSIRCHPVDWLISLGYDWFSGYGRFPGKALACLLTVNLMAIGVYRYVFHFGSCVVTDYHVSNITNTSFTHLRAAIFFGLQNVVNPASILSDKSLITASNPLMIFLAIVQFSMSYVLLLLFALAVRARFQKGGG